MTEKCNQMISHERKIKLTEHRAETSRTGTENAQSAILHLDSKENTLTLHPRGVNTQKTVKFKNRNCSFPKTRKNEYKKQDLIRE